VKKELKEIEKRIKDYERSVKPLYSKRIKLQEKITQEEHKKNIGNCYLLREKDYDGKYFSAFFKIIGLSEYEQFTVMEIENNSSEGMGIRISPHSNYLLFSKDYKAITEKRFNKELEKMLSTLKEKENIFKKVKT